MANTPIAMKLQSRKSAIQLVLSSVQMAVLLDLRLSAQSFVGIASQAGLSCCGNPKIAFNRRLRNIAVLRFIQEEKSDVTIIRKKPGSAVFPRR